MQRHRPNAFTLLETLLTLGVLVVLAALSWPSVAAWGRGSPLVRAADDIQAILVGLRVHAMESGQRYEFAFQPETNVYRIRTANVYSVAAATSPEDAKQRVTFDSDQLMGEHSLESELKFSAASTGTGQQQALGGGFQAAVGDVTNENWQTIEFRPDGSATETRFELSDDVGGRRSIHVRGLTGVITVIRPAPTATSGAPASRERGAR